MQQEVLGTLWDHLEDLRKTFLSSLWVIGLDFFAILTFYQPIFSFLTDQQQLLSESQLVKSTIQREIVENLNRHPVQFILPSNATIIKKNKEEVSLSEKMVPIQPGESLEYEVHTSPQLLIMGPIDGISLVVKIAFWLSLSLTAPLWGWFWFCFISPGLNSREKTFLLSFLSLSFLFLAGGFAFAYYITVPIANHYLSTFNLSLGQNMWTLTYYVNYVLLLCLGHSVAAEIVLILFILVHQKILSSVWLMSKRRLMVVVAFILGAVLTPPDVLSQLCLAIPFVILYELAIVYAIYLEKNSSPTKTSRSLATNIN